MHHDFMLYIEEMFSAVFGNILLSLFHNKIFFLLDAWY